MNKLISLVDLLLNNLDKENQGRLIISSDHQLISCSDKFKDIYKLSNKSLSARSESPSLKEAMNRMENPQHFLNSVMDIYKKNNITCIEFYFKNGELMRGQFYPFLTEEKMVFIWTSTIINLENKDKKNYLKLLTRREKEVLQNYIFGYTAKMIANKLFISVRTAETHIQNIKEKLNCYNRSELVYLVREWGLINIIPIADEISYLNGPLVLPRL